MTYVEVTHDEVVQLAEKVKRYAAEHPKVPGAANNFAVGYQVIKLMHEKIKAVAAAEGKSVARIELEPWERLENGTYRSSYSFKEV
jgi:hypothetical protein